MAMAEPGHRRGGNGRGHVEFCQEFGGSVRYRHRMADLEIPEEQVFPRHDSRSAADRLHGRAVRTR